MLTSLIAPNLVPFCSFIFRQAQPSEEPPFLTVGTDVSAKYRGAFCEANVKVVKKLVKCKVSEDWNGFPTRYCFGFLFLEARKAVFLTSFVILDYVLAFCRLHLLKQTLRSQLMMIVSKALWRYVLLSLFRHHSLVLLSISYQLMLFSMCCFSATCKMSLFFSLKVGAVVEAKNPDGQFMEGVITKLTDASVYTVGKNSFSLSKVPER